MAISDVKTVREGSAEVLSPFADVSAQAGGDGPQKQDVFYNPAQVFNRDFSVLVLNVYSKIRQIEEAEKLRIRDEKYRKRLEQDPSAQAPQESQFTGLNILEALAASGLRSVRYWKEVECVQSIVCNDLDPTAVAHMRRNLAHNKVPEGGDSASGSPTSAAPARGVRPNQGNAILHMYTHEGNYDVIDLDPYGTASPFLDCALSTIKSGGLLCVTSTDMPILGGNHPETCFYRYGGTALKAKYVHEMSLRLLMNAIQSTAARHQRYVEPLVSISIDFYVRVFVRVYDGASSAKAVATCTGLVYQCTQCESFHIQPLGDIEEPDKKKTGKRKHKGTQYPFAANEETPPVQEPMQAEHTGDASDVKRATYVASASSSCCFSGDMSPPFAKATMQKLLGATEGGEGALATAEPQQGHQKPTPRYRVARGREEINGVCNECSGRFNVGGPFYLGSLYNKEFIQLCLNVCKLEALEHVVSWKKINGLLTAMDEEIESIPLHYDLPSLCSSLKLQTIPLKQFRGILRSLGYQVSHFHREPNAIKTDASNSVIYDILRRWALHTQSKQEGNDDKQSAAKANQDKKANPPAHIDVIMRKTTQGGGAEWEQRLTSIDFDESYATHDESEGRPNKVARFLPNPEKNWGPKPRAKPVREGTLAASKDGE